MHKTALPQPLFHWCTNVCTIILKYAFVRTTLHSLINNLHGYTQSWLIEQLNNGKLMQTFLQAVMYKLYMQYSNHNETAVQQVVNSANVL